MSWWFTELRGCLPAWVLGLLFGPNDRLELRIGRDTATIYLVDGKDSRELGSIATDADAASDAVRKAKQMLRRASRSDRRTTIRLADSKVLRPRVQLPIAAAEHLREALSFEMDRHTPFAPSDVLFDFRVSGSDPEMQRLDIDLEVARKDDVREAAVLARRLGLLPDRVTGTRQAAEADYGLNLLPDEERANRSQFMSYATSAMIILTIMLGAGALGTWIERRERVLDRTEMRLQELRARAGAAAQQQEKVEQLQRLSRFLVEERQRRPLVVATLDEVSQRVPDQHWLVTFALKDESLTLTGYSDDPSELLRLLEQSDLLANARFAAPVTHDRRTGKERFSVAVDLVRTEFSE